MGRKRADIVNMTEHDEHDRTLEEVDVIPVSGSRKRWMFLVWVLTFYVPDFLIRRVGRMKRKDVRTAWREKLAINLLIWFSCLLVTFFISTYVPSSEEGRLRDSGHG